MTRIDLPAFQAIAVGVAIFGATSCLSGALLLLPPHALNRSQFAGHLLRALAFGFLHGLFFGLIWGIIFGLIAQAVELGLAIDPVQEAVVFMVGVALGGAAGLSTGTATKIWWIVRRRRPPAPTLSWARLVGSLVVGCSLGLANHGPTTASDRVESVLIGGFVFCTIPLLPAVDWWTEELLTNHRVAYGLALLACGAAVATIALWLKSSIGVA
jgi:hypothetical protein